MPLQKNITTEFGVDATYHRIVRFDLDLLGKKSHLIIGGYLTKQAYLDGKSPISFTNATIDTPEFISGLEESEIATSIYTILKTIPAFEGATDA